jgi:CDP-paratose 2-epimerase
MNYKNILITGGAGFVGSNFAIKLRENFPQANIFALDNLKRRGSELNIPRLKKNMIQFIHGDVRNKEDLKFKEVDLLIECSAEPSVLAGVDSSPEYVINTNLIGAINCFELARVHQADVVFLSTSRVYPISYVNQLNYQETETRFELSDDQSMAGASGQGISENFPLNTVRSIYGSTKLSAELILQEYIASYKIKGIIDRCGVITGPWQMGKVDQGVIALWMAKHISQRELSYIGFNGSGKQVRDFIHVDDLFEAVLIQLKDIASYSGEVFNIGGGKENSLSLLELTKLCQKITGNKIKIGQVKQDRANDLRIYITDSSKFIEKSGWQIKKDAKQTLRDIYAWMKQEKDQLINIFN